MKYMKTAEQQAYEAAQFNIDNNATCGKLKSMIETAVDQGKFSLETTIPKDDYKTVNNTLRAYGYRVYGDAAITDFDGNVDITIEWSIR